MLYEVITGRYIRSRDHAGRVVNMAVREILLYPDPRLKEVCSPVDRLDAATDALVQDLVDTMIAAGHSVGVAAPQIGATRRVVVVDVSGSKMGRDHNHGLLTIV